MKKLFIILFSLLSLGSFGQTVVRMSATASGTNTYSTTFNPTVSIFNQNTIYVIPFTNTNSSGTVTVDPDDVGSGSAVSIKGSDGNNLAVGAIVSGGTYSFKFNGTVLRMIGAWEQDAGGGSSTFEDLTDGPGSFSGKALNYTRVNAGATALEYRTASQVRSDIGAGTGDGTVTSIGVTLGTTGTDIGVSGSPVTSSGNITLNVPSSSASNRGLLTAADWTTFNGKQSAITFGTGVQTALGVNVGSAGAPVLFNGAGGTPSSLTLTNATGLPAASVVVTPAGNIGSTNAGAAINELDTEKSPIAGNASLVTTGTLTTGGTGSGFTLSFTNSTLSGRIAEANIPAKYIIDQATPSTTGGTITLDCNSQIQRSHVGSATFSAAKVIALSNTTNALFFNFMFEITSVSAVLTFPSDWESSSLDFNGTTWTPPNTGKFEFGGSFDAVNSLWKIKIAGPFQ